MNRTDRLMAIVLELQKHKEQRAEDLAATFETSVRTIYRDVQALSEAGVPIRAVPGQGYSLMEGYFLPPVSFHAEEAAALLLGLDAIEPLAGGPSRGHAASARSKIEAILPADVRERTDAVRSRVRVLSFPPRQRETVELLRQAAAEERSVRIRYRAKDARYSETERETERVIDPYGIVYVQGAWVAIAHCRLRQSLRHFRIDRMSDVVWTDERFTRPADFSIRDYEPGEDRRTEVRIRLRGRAIDRFRETDYFYVEESKETEDGLMVTLKVRYEEEILHWVLGWAEEALVLEPESLKRKVAAAARNIAGLYGR
ncbi:helix-turn-helix transcriptional regulator [Paenibacillus hamazuiensis]|uniref:helix-turn-helix transcriptional regulator n=1 Tax=Paenibacillus hamazuiensis TaxID=2936508 RepID=UPI0020103B2F|nr:YafY family protein [Paenibacillus hamazuiensis]